MTYVGFAVLESFNLFLVDIEPDHLEADADQCSNQRETYIAQADNRDGRGTFVVFCKQSLYGQTLTALEHLDPAPRAHRQPI